LSEIGSVLSEIGSLYLSHYLIIESNFELNFER
jgi:hypothetical protein